MLRRSCLFKRSFSSTNSVFGCLAIRQAPRMVAPSALAVALSLPSPTANLIRVVTLTVVGPQPAGANATDTGRLSHINDFLRWMGLSQIGTVTSRSPLLWVTVNFDTSTR